MKEKDIMKLAAQVEDWMTAIRRQLHQNPELGFEEEQTQALICAQAGGAGGGLPDPAHLGGGADSGGPAGGHRGAAGGHGRPCPSPR